MTPKTDVARNAAARLKHKTHTIELFDAEVLHTRVTGLPAKVEIVGTDGRTLPLSLAFPAPDELDEGEKRRREWHIKMLNHPMGATRTLVQPSRDLTSSLAMLGDCAPQFSDVLDLIGNANVLALSTRTALRLPPILLVGEPGIGKTWFLKRLAACLGTESLFIALNTMTDRGSTLTGLSPAWKTAGPGKIAKSLLNGETASPLVVLDEIDKISPINPAETPIEALHSLLEPENASAFCDEFLDVALDASHIMWFASANDASRLPASILDRFVVFHIEITDDQRRQLHQNVFKAVNAQYGNTFSLYDPTVLDLIADRSPRAMTRLWPVVFGYALRVGLRQIAPFTIEMGIELLEQSAKTKIGMGFLSDVKRVAPDHHNTVPEGPLRSRE